MQEALDFISGISKEALIIAVSSLIILAFASYATFWITRHKGLDRKFFADRWKKVMKMTKKTDMWYQVIIESDKLLDEALKRRRFNGKTMGERLISASKELKDQDSVWRAHKLRNRVVHETDVVVKGKDMKMALKGYHQALKDLGAL